MGFGMDCVVRPVVALIRRGTAWSRCLVHKRVFAPEFEIGAALPIRVQCLDAFPGSPDGLRLMETGEGPSGAFRHTGQPSTQSRIIAPANVARGAWERRSQMWDLRRCTRVKSRNVRRRYTSQSKAQRGKTLGKPGDSGCQGPANPLHLWPADDRPHQWRKQ